MSGNFLVGSFSGGILKFVNKYVLMMKFCCQTNDKLILI